jgi:hypothetical protein
MGKSNSILGKIKMGSLSGNGHYIEDKFGMVCFAGGIQPSNHLGSGGRVSAGAKNKKL